MEFVTYEQDGFVGIVTINRPKALNALNSEVLKEIEAAFDAIDLDATRAVILTGAARGMPRKYRWGRCHFLQSA